MATTRNRIERLERELEFRVWVRHTRILESLSIDELEILATTAQYPERPEPSPGMSPIDDMEREELRKQWQEEEQGLAGRTRQDLAFFCLHGHWPERACGTECMRTEEREREIQGNFGGNSVSSQEV